MGKWGFNPTYRGQKTCEICKWLIIMVRFSPLIGLFPSKWPFHGLCLTGMTLQVPPHQPDAGVTTRMTLNLVDVCSRPNREFYEFHWHPEWGEIQAHTQRESLSAHKNVLLNVSVRDGFDSLDGVGLIELHM